MKPKIQKELFSNKSVATPKHDEMLLRFSKGSKEMNNLLLTIMLKLKLLSGRIIKWEAEKVLKGKNGFYIGSVDLYVCFEGRKNIYEKGDLYNLIIEFKPKIISFSETIRQIKLYSESFPKERQVLCIITHSDISQFKKMFEYENIHLIQTKENIKNQTKLK